MGDMGQVFREGVASSGTDDVKAQNRKLCRENADLRARLAELERLADTDPLTPLPNRRVFIRETERAVATVLRHGTPAAVMFVDVDGLKTINDAWGHGAGDAALRHVAHILRREVRTADVVARIGGDEFGLVLDHLDETAARAKGVALLAAIRREPLDFGMVVIEVGLSLGLAMIQPDDTAASVMHRADREMYASKGHYLSDR